VRHLIKNSVVSFTAALTLMSSNVSAEDPDFPGAFEPEGWSVSVGAGALAIPTYEGSDDAGIGANLGRNSSDSSNLTGFSDINPTAEAKIFADYRFKYAKVGFAYAQDLLNEHGGFTLTSQVATGLPIPAIDAFISPSVSVTYASNDYNQSFFGITPVQSANSGLNTFTAGAGFKDVSLNLLMAKKLNENWTLASLLSYKRLVGDIAESPLVLDRNQRSAGLVLNYKF